MTNINKGLSSSEVQTLQSSFGYNVLTPPKRDPWYVMLLDGFKGSLIIILLVAACVSLVIGILKSEYSEPIGIIVAIAIAVGIGFWNTWSASKKFDLLLTSSDDTLVKVRRNGSVLEVARRELVVGDVVLLSAGEEIPADCIVKEFINLKVDESSLTGESIPVSKYDYDKANGTYPTNHIYKSTIVSEGTCVGEVFAIGDETEIGKTARGASSITDVETPLNKQLNGLASLINKIAFSAAGILIISLLVRYIFIEQGYVGKEPIGIVNDCLQFLMIAVALIVVAVPEGLPMAVTLALAYSMKRMAKSNNLIRKMHACETLGSTTLILTDKTGTLTENKMKVVHTDGINQYSHFNIVLNSTACLNKDNETIGNPTEGACLKWADLTEEDIDTIRKEYTIVDRVDFNSKNKYMITTVEMDDSNITYIKGAPEVIKNYCKNQEAIPDVSKQQKLGRRCIAFAHKTTVGKYSLDSFIWDGYAAIEDPVRTNVPDAIRVARNAGIKVKIVTGDNPETACSIAKDANISDKPNYMLGCDIAGQTMSNLTKTDVFARTRPEDKQELVKKFQQIGEVVASVGDGSNDSAALNQAEVGIAMNNGTDIAKNAADVILLDNSFPSIILGVKWGRSLYKNIQHFILFQLTVNVVAILIACVGPFIGVDLPFTVTQMLWVNLIMDTFAALALATEPANDAVMNDRPRDPKAFIITKAMWTEILGIGIIYTGILLYLLISNIYSLTEFFTIFVMLQFWNLFNARVFGQDRSIFDGLGKNVAFIGICLVIFIGQVLIVQFGGDVFRTEPLDIETWFKIVGITAMVPVVRELFYWIKKLFKV